MHGCAHEHEKIDMLKFQRTKLVDIVNNGDNTITVHGVLDDHIYHIEIDLVIGCDNLSIQAIQGKWLRSENTECRRAIPFLAHAVGIRIDEDGFPQRINKYVGRKSCPHFANLIIECCDAAEDAMRVMGYEAARAENPGLRFEDMNSASKSAAPPQKSSARPGSPPVAQREAGVKGTPHQRDARGFYVDLHMHSYPASQCSTANIDDLIVEAKTIGLDAVCLTDHNHVWPSNEIEALKQKHEFPILRGNEITTDQGDMLVFGMYQDVKGIINLSDLRELVEAAGGFMIAAHPFRGFLVFNTSQIGMTVEKAMQSQVFQQVDAMEVLNGKVTRPENDFAAQVAAGMKLPATGGSDAHAISDVGRYVTCFQQNIETEQDLVGALKQGNYKPFMYHKFRQ